MKKAETQTSISARFVSLPVMANTAIPHT